MIGLFHANILEKLVNYRDYAGHNVELILPNKVFEELKKSRKMGEIEDLLKRIFKVLETPEEIMREIGLRKHGLGLGELSVLAVATFLIQQETQSSVITIIDDKRGRRAAEELGLKRHGTLWMITQLKKNMESSTRKRR